MSSDNEFASLSGDFAGYNNCLIGVGSIVRRDLVYRVLVNFPNRDTWSSLSSNYFFLKKMLTEKYGDPDPLNSMEEFKSDPQPQDDSSKLYQVKFDNCIYMTTYNTEKGIIQLSIAHIGVTQCFVFLSYFDKINTDIAKEKASDDL